MLRSTFIIVPGIGLSTERELWKQGIKDWGMLLENLDDARIGTASKEDCRRTLETAEQMLADGNHQYFAKKLGVYEAWRAWDAFRARTVYLDVETDGRTYGDCLTVVGLYDGKEFRVLVRDRDLDTFVDAISHYSLIVTFFGAGFDLPVLQKSFWDFKFDQIHLDLCPTLKRLGYHGGLKQIERQCGIQRQPEVDGLSGLDAVLLWNRHLRGEEGALERLIEYNKADVVNLEKLAEIACLKLERLLRPAQLSLGLA